MIALFGYFPPISISQGEHSAGKYVKGNMRTILSLSLFALTIGLSGCDLDFDEGIRSSREQEDFHYTYDFKPGSRLLLDNYNGAVEISGWDQPKIEIHGTKFANTRDRLAQIKIDIARTSESVNIRTVPPLERLGNSGARYQIRVPKQAILELIKSTNGSLRVSDIDGAANLRTTNGSVRAAGLQGALSASSTNGTVECIDINGGATVRTTNGRIKLESIRGSIEANTTNGSINAEMVASSPDRRTRLSTTNGSVDLRIPNDLKSDVRASTTNGSITVSLPGSANFQVTARTSGASVKSEFPVVGEISKKSIEGRVGSGGPLIDLTTSNGGISLNRGI